ncbi:IscS subfamily cysteine desulfurase [Halobacillus sp. BBL2006]|uniref:IscS subfamily cysteine desulfurase n=1 Tax=Halobacillus sp. BBL2006 TaxID=1543706 RepID=UPI0005420D2E|nr:IscS subfamily cysteine desulfurase [Halobacillus sp. BBL2006]KHE73051.1 cysteine desulfurase [Halobacillus sp. BBL2006]
MTTYFDYAATCPIDEEALEAYMKASKEFYGNTSSLHDAGTKAAKLLEHCRTSLANLMNVKSEGIYFTSGGTESNVIGIQALLDAHPGNHIIASAAEHSSIQHLLEKLEQEGYEISRVSLTPEGILDIKELESLIREETALVTIQHVNADIGTVQPIQRIHTLCKKWGSLFHSDCVQSFGKVDLASAAPYFDSFSISSHKVYGPKGVGAVYIRPSLSFQPLLPNVIHESGVRAGTVNTPGIAGFLVAADKSVASLEEHQSVIRKRKEYFMELLTEAAGELTVLGGLNEVPILGLCIKGMDGQWAMLEANRKGYAFSTGSACQVRSEGPPQTLLSMGFSEQNAKTFIRLSFSHLHSEEDVKGLADCLKQIMADQVRKVNV